MSSKINIYNKDCLPAMKKMANDQYDLAIVDPPYGINIKTRIYGDNKKWDHNIPTKEYFEQLFRISKNQIILGANYFLDYLGCASSILIWDKKDTTVTGLWRAEIAWISFNGNTYIFKTNRPGERGFFTVDCNRIHPTQKPVALYKYCLKNYAKPGDKILDTHFGSLSIGIACWDYGFDLDAYEIDKDYFEAGKKRLETHQAQLQLY